MAKIVPPTDDFTVFSGVVFKVESENGAVSVSMDLDNGKSTTVTLPGVTSTMVKEFLGSDEPGTPALLLSLRVPQYSVGIGNPGTGSWLMRFGY